MAEIFEMARRGKVWLIGSGETRINPIHGADLGSYIVECLEQDPIPSEREVGGPDAFSQLEIAALASAVLNKPLKTSKINTKLVRLAARIAKAVNKNLAALAMMFSLLGESDALGPAYGSHHLGEFFAELAKERE